MSTNPYQPPQAVNATWRPAPAQLPWALGGLALGLAASPFLLVALVVSMHEYHDPPIAEELMRAWRGALVLTMIGGVLGALCGALARNILFWRRL